MSTTKNTISSAIEQFMILQKNSLEIISKLSEIATSTKDSVVFNITNDDGTVSEIPVSSMGFFKSEVQRIDNSVQSLAGLGDSSAVLKMPDGTTKKIFEASVLRDPTKIDTLQVPKEFRIRNNWFFESFLNPLLYVSFDVASKVPADMEKAVVKRIITQTDTDEKKKFFDDNYKGKNDIVYEAFLMQLDANDITYFVDEEILDLPLSVIRFSGTFDVLKAIDENVDITSNSTTVTVKKRKYKLNKLTYSDVLSGVADSKILKTGDQLITGDGSKYQIDSVDAAQNTIILKRLAGSQPITIGVSVLTIYSETFASKEVQINVGFDERQVIFVKPIEPKFNVAASQWSSGTGIFTNELTIQIPSGTQTLEDFYKSQVVDFGMQFINAAKEKAIPSVNGEIPDAPTLTDTNFQVVPITEHKKDTKEADEIKNKLSNKVQLENQISALDQAINNKKNDLNNNSNTKSDAEKRKIKADLETLAREKVSQVNLYSSTVKDLATKARANPAVSDATKYRVRGFWPVPEPKVSTVTNPQEVIQFKVAYRYIKKDGGSPQTKQMEFIDNDGNKKTGFFSNWTEFKSDIRGRVFNETTGFYEWGVEDVTNPDTVNINQLDVSISKGEQIQIKVKSISEAGWPLNPLESDWSAIQTIDFPDNLQIEDETTAILSETASEETRVKFQEELNSRGLDLHLISSFTSGDRYFAHQATDIASGFFTAEGKVIDVLEKLKSMDTELQTLRQLIEKAKGFLVIYLIDSDGNVTKIGPNSTTQIFAGYYKDLITTGTGTSITFSHGKVITKTYILRIENGAATTLELASYMPGGIANIVDVSSSSTNNDYKNNRKYDIVPLSLSGITSGAYNTPAEVAPFQSAQVKSLWLYMRERTVGLDDDMYSLTNISNPNDTVSQGVPTAPILTTPVNGCYLLPTQPMTGTDPNVWNGVGIGTGNGALTEFCIHKDHPDAIISAITGPSATALLMPQVNTDLSYNYPKFFHSDFFWKDATDVDAKKQLQYIIPKQSPAPTTSTTDLQHFPAKIGFSKNDEFLMGKYTCGSYLYLAPLNYNAIAVDGSTELAKKLLEFGEEKAVNIPLVFQFRCSDKLAYIGGFRTTGNISNITYIKKIGIDIQARNETLLSFDIEVSCKYEQDSLVQPTYVPNVSLDRLSAIRVQSSQSNTTSI